MNLGFETIGNATLIAYDEKPVLVTDPWIQGSAYFGSWTLTHAIPDAQRRAILECPYVWFSHGHPDHLNPESVPLFKGKKILLPNHLNGRIHKDLVSQGFDVEVMPDATWKQISPRVRFMSIADLGQDAICLLDVGGRLIVNTNDCGENGWGTFVRKIVRQYPVSFLMSLSGYGDADMNHFFTESGEFIPPEGFQRKPFGHLIAEATEKMGCRYFAVSSSLHRYQRSDSAWANAMIPGLDDYAVGFKSTKCELLPAFLRYDCATDQWEKINPPENPIEIFPPEKFGDSWSEKLDAADVQDATRYFGAVESLKDGLGFIRLKVGGVTHEIKIGDEAPTRGITFEAPKHSLMSCIRWEIFDDMLIGNFMKTTLHGPWPRVSLHPYFSGFVCKYADNGLAKTKAEVKAYQQEYERRWPRLRLLRWESRAKQSFREAAGESSLAVRTAKKVYRALKR